MTLSNKGLRYWLPNYIFRFLIKKERPDPKQPIHIFICIVDHFEPFNGPTDYKTALFRVKKWKDFYPNFANRHIDFDGKPLQHTWFYPPHLDHSFIPHLVELCLEGYGDIEMHLHHNHMDPFPDTPQTLKCKILNCIDDYGKYGIFCQPNSDPRFAFIHGDWSLNNSGGETLCGVNNELKILKDCGCYADFTFPCLNKSQPSMVNQIYYSDVDTILPKAYDKGSIVSIKKEQPANSLMLIQGIIGLRSDKRKRFKMAIEYCDLSNNSNPTLNRAQYWLKNSLSIKGQPNFKFIKLHTHGAPEENWEANWGKEADKTFSYLEKYYNDGKKYILHYTTAREMYNVIKWLEVGNTNFSNNSLNFEINPYIYK